MIPPFQPKRSLFLLAEFMIHLLSNTLLCVLVPLDAGEGIVVDDKPTICTFYLGIIGDYHSVERMRVGIEQSTHTIAKQQEERLVSQDTNPRTLAITLLSLFNGMRVMIVLGVDRDELRSRWIEIIIALFKGSGIGIFTSKCPTDCVGFDICKKKQTV